MAFIHASGLLGTGLVPSACARLLTPPTPSICPSLLRPHCCSAPRRRCPALHASERHGAGGGPRDGEFTDEDLHQLLGDVRRYREGSGDGSSTDPIQPGGDAGQAGASSVDNAGEVQDTLVDLMQMEVRRARVHADMASDLEARKERLRAIGEEMHAALAREYELDRMRTEMGANYAMSEALSALDDVEAEVARIKAQMQADRADLADWEARSAEERSRGLFFKSLYSQEKQPARPVGRSIPGYWRKQQELADAAAAAAAEATAAAAAAAIGAPAATAQPAARSEHLQPPASRLAGPLPTGAWGHDTPEGAAGRPPRPPPSIRGRPVRSPLNMHLYAGSSAALALLVLNDLAAPAAGGPRLLPNVAYGIFSALLGLNALLEHRRQQRHRGK